MFRHPFWAVGSHRPDHQLPELPKPRSTGGCYHLKLSPCLSKQYLEFQATTKPIAKSELIPRTIPPTILFVGVYFTHKYKRYTILQKVYYLYNWTYLILLAILAVYSFSNREPFQ